MRRIAVDCVAGTAVCDGKRARGGRCFFRSLDESRSCGMRALQAPREPAGHWLALPPRDRAQAIPVGFWSDTSSAAGPCTPYCHTLWLLLLLLSLGLIWSGTRFHKLAGSEGDQGVRAMSSQRSILAASTISLVLLLISLKYYVALVSTLTVPPIPVNVACRAPCCARTMHHT